MQRLSGTIKGHYLDKFLIVDLTIAVHIGLADHVIDIRVSQVLICDL